MGKMLLSKKYFVGLSVPILMLATMSYGQNVAETNPNVIHIFNRTGNTVSSNATIVLTTSTGRTITLPHYSTISVNTASDYSICASNYDPVSKMPQLEIVSGSECTGNAPDGAAIIPIPTWWTGETIKYILATTYITNVSSDKSMLTLYQEHKGFSNLIRDTSLNIVTPTDLTTANLSLDSSLQQSKNITFNFSNNDLTFDKNLKMIKFNASDFPTISGSYFDQPFKSIVFTGPDGIKLSQYKIKTAGTINAILTDQSLSQYQPKGWPNYVISGGVEDFSDATTKGLEDRKTVDAIFKYAGNDGGGDNGVDPYKLFYTAKATIRTVAAAQTISKNLNHVVRPVMVVYTSNASGGDQKEAEKQLTDEDDLQKHLGFLAITSVYLEHHLVIFNNTYMYGAIVINPDTYGEGHKDHYYENVQVPIHTALTNMINDYLLPHQFITTDKAADLQQQINTLFNTDKGNFKMYNQALNWIVQQLAPHVSYGFADNVWAGDSSGHDWLHISTKTSIANHATSEANYLIDNGVYGNPSTIGNPTFIAFDKYERNTFVKGTAPTSAYFYNNNDWGTYINYVSQVADQLGTASKATNNIMPIMLFQIPGGHIAPASEANWMYGATAPDYFLGDQTVCNGTTNEDVLNSLDNPLIAADYGQANVDKYSNYYNYAYAAEEYPSYDQAYNVSQNCLMNGHMADLITHHVFAILWGGGSTTSIAGPQDDGGYLANLIRKATHYNFSGEVIPDPYPQ